MTKEPKVYVCLSRLVDNPDDPWDPYTVGATALAAKEEARRCAGDSWLWFKWKVVRYVPAKR